MNKGLKRRIGDEQLSVGADSCNFSLMNKGLKLEILVRARRLVLCDLAIFP